MLACHLKCSRNLIHILRTILINYRLLNRVLSYWHFIRCSLFNWRMTWFKWLIIFIVIESPTLWMTFLVVSASYINFINYFLILWKFLLLFYLHIKRYSLTHILGFVRNLLLELFYLWGSLLPNLIIALYLKYLRYLLILLIQHNLFTILIQKLFNPLALLLVPKSIILIFLLRNWNLWFYILNLGIVWTVSLTILCFPNFWLIKVSLFLFDLLKLLLGSCR